MYWQLTLILSAIVMAVYMSDNTLKLGSIRVDTEHTEGVGSFSRGMHFLKAAVSADHKICSEYGSFILQKGGNAVDAAITAMLCTGVVNGHSVSIGGSHYMVIYNKGENAVETIDARDAAPGAANESTFHTEGGLSIAIPGDISGFWLAHQRHGKLPWKDLFQPAIKLASEGIPLTLATAMAIKKPRVEEEHIFLSNSPSLRHLLTKPNGRLLEEGDLFVRPKYAETLRKISEGSDRAFYEGPLAHDIVADIGEHGGIVTVDDLKEYHALIREPIVTTLGNFTLYTPPPTSGGAVMSLILNILKGYNLGPDDVYDDNETLLWNHRIIEAFKFAHVYRAQLGDDKFDDIEMLLKNITSEEHASYLRSRIDDNQTHDPEYYGKVLNYPEDGGTSHVSVIDQYGNGVALTSTINEYFGSGVHGSRTGIIFNNGISNFAGPHKLIAESQNKMQPGKRPLSAMSPAVILNGNRDVKMAIGSAGGSRIITTNALIILETIMLGKDIRSSVSKPRFHHQRIPNDISYEPFIDKKFIAGLKTYGHQCESTALFKIYSVVMAILREQDGLYAYPDHRKPGGLPAGF